MHPALLAFASKLQKEALPGIWARGLQLSREGNVHCDRWQGTPEEENLEITLRVRAADRPVAYLVSLWPFEEDAHCNCLAKVEPCEHIVASILAVKAGLRPATSLNDPPKTTGIANRANTSVVPILFLREQELFLRRVLQVPGKDLQPLTTSLTSLVGATQSGRLAIPPILATPADYRLDAFFSPHPTECSLNRLNPEGKRQLLKVLSEIPTLVFEGDTDSNDKTSTQIPLRIGASQSVSYTIIIEDQGPGQNFSARLKPQEDTPEGGQSPSKTRILGGLFGLKISSASGEPPSATLFLIEPAGGKASGTFGGTDLSGFTRSDEVLLKELQASPSPIRFSLEDAVLNWVPRLDRWSRVLGGPIRVEMRSKHFPKWVDAPICLTLEAHHLEPGDWSVRAQLHYVQTLPPAGQAWNESATLATLSSDFITKTAQVLPRRNLEREQTAARRLQEKLGLRFGQSIRVSKELQWEWRKKILSFLEGSQPPCFLLGSAQDAMGQVRSLQPKLKLSGETLKSLEGSLSFEVDAPSGALHPRVDPAAVMKAWREGQSWVRLLDGGFAAIPQEWLSRFGEQISRILARNDSKGTQAALATQSTLALAGDPFGLLALAATHQTALEQNGIRFSNSIRALLEQNLDTVPSEVRATSQIQGLESRIRPALVLRDYQKAGIRWLQARAAQGLGAVLGDDMGLGKTLQALLAVQGRVLVVCPASVLSAWRQQVETFTTDKIISYTGPQRASLLQQVSHSQQNASRPQIVLTTYGILRQDHITLSQLTWDSIILDEAQTIKNPDSQVSIIAHQLRAQFKVALTGTPIENHLGDLWSIFRFALPELLGERASFRESWEDPIAHGKGEALGSLRRRIRPFFLRRLKSEVAQELPEKQEVTLQCELSESEMNYYQAILLSSRQQIVQQLQSSHEVGSNAPGQANGAAVLRALELLLRLRQASCHPALTPNPPPEFAPGSHSSKTQVLMESLKEATEAGHRSLVFSQWTSFLDLLQNLLLQEGISFDRLDGSTRDREGVVKRFQDPKGPSVLLLSLKAGGTGLTLTAADHVYLMDPWWNPSVESQAADRAHRIGQNRKVLIHRLVAQGTVEERISLLQGHKKSLAEALLSSDDHRVDSGGGVSPRPLREDLLELLQSL
jgi:superfamily II DNA or RNA helicase